MHSLLYYTEETDSTNNLLKQRCKEEKLPEFSLVYTDFQNAGRGQTGNSWEAERGKNLLFSILFYPAHVHIGEHFILSQIVAVAVAEVLNEIIPGFKVKWPNDIYFEDKKIAGILIENTLTGGIISSSIAGVGININQETFKSDAPNPVSLLQLSGKEFERNDLLNKICARIQQHYTNKDKSIVRKRYSDLLYRNNGFYKFRDTTGIFDARIKKIMPDGQLILTTELGEDKKYYFKEVEFMLF